MLLSSKNKSNENNKEENNKFKKWNIIYNDYIDTLDRISVDNLPNNKFIQKPFIQKYFIELIKLKEKKLINDYILQKTSEESIEIDDILYIFTNIFNLTKNDKKIIQEYFYMNKLYNSNSSLSSSSTINNDINYIISNLLFFYIKYIEFYLLTTELLYNNNIDFLNQDIFFYIQNNQKIISKKIKFWKNNNQMNRIHTFIIFNNNLQELFYNYKSLYNILSNKNWLSKSNSKIIFNHFLKFLFTPWFNINKQINNQEFNKQINNQESNIQINNIELNKEINNQESNKEINNQESNKEINNQESNKEINNQKSLNNEKQIKNNKIKYIFNIFKKIKNSIK